MAKKVGAATKIDCWTWVRSAKSCAESASSMFVLRKTSGCFGRSSFSGDYRLRPAPCGDFRLILVRDLRGMKEAGGRYVKYIC